MQTTCRFFTLNVCIMSVKTKHEAILDYTAGSLVWVAVLYGMAVMLVLPL